MHFVTAIAISLSLLSTTSAGAQRPEAMRQGAAQMEIYRTGSRPAAEGAPETFTGSVRIEPLFDANEASAVSAARVTFAPGARTAWHTHPKGQRLIVTDGIGWTGEESGAVEEIRAGDVVWCPPGVTHWHGATPNASMTHIAIQETLNGKAVDWMEHVTDEQYRR